MDIRQARYWSFVVLNGYDQAVTVQLIGRSGQAGSSAGVIGAGGVVAAGTEEPVATNIFSPFIGLNFQCVIAPTAGALTIWGYKQFEVPFVPGEVVGPSTPPGTSGG